MTEGAPIPTDEFAAALDELDREAFAYVVGRLWADTGDETAVEPPLVTVRGEDGRTTLLVEPAESESALDAVDADAIVVRDDPPDSAASLSSAGETAPSVVTPAELRNRLLYALSPSAAESIADEYLGKSVRSPSYADDGSASGAGDNDGETPTGDGDSDDGGGDTPAAAASGFAADSPDRTGSVSDAPRDVTEPSPGSGGSRSSSGGGSSGAPTDQRGAGENTRRVEPRIAVVAVTLLLLFAVSGGVVSAAEMLPGGDAGTFSGTADGPDEMSASDDRRAGDATDPNGSATGTLTADDVHPAGNVAANLSEAERTVRLEPTCTRSALHVVQIQMNALKYNDNETNDGIRTVRRFASPQNRQAIDTLERFVAAVKSPTFSPMLTYDSAQFTPVQLSGDYAQVQVVTRENGTVTGRYDFRLRKVQRGEYDGCWMTDTDCCNELPVIAGYGVGGDR